ncbi:MAG: redox-regulated ATPase YchF [Planctomycetes bacterium]|nr:redox-regulated ATPase YchF [Planctomycetota bacterium]
MKIGLVGVAGSGKSTVFGALTGVDVSASHKTNLAAVKVPDPRVDALARLFKPKKTTCAEIAFTDIGGGRGGLDRAALNAMRDVDALCQVVRAFPDAAGAAPAPLAEIDELVTETILADLEIVERRVKRLEKERSDPNELALLERLAAGFEAGKPARALGLGAEELARVAHYQLLTTKPLLLVLNVPEDAAGRPAPPEVAQAAAERGLGLVVLSASVEHDIALMDRAEQGAFLASLGLEEPAQNRFVRAAFATADLISMLTAGPDECRAWPIPRGMHMQRAARSIHSDLERGFIRAEVVTWSDLVELGSEARCREAGKLRTEGRNYVVRDGDVVHILFSV